MTWQERFDKEFGYLGKMTGEYIKDFISKLLEEKKEYTVGWEQKCSGCGHHDSMWKSLVSSPEWDAWYDHCCESEDNRWDVDECRALGIMSAKHFKAFIAFIRSLPE